MEGQLRIKIPRQSARAKKSKQKARAKREQRTAHGVLRYRKIEIPAPAPHQDKAPVTLWVVHVRESSPPADVKPVEWFLLTTCAITTVEQAHECLRWYCLRWRIEGVPQAHRKEVRNGLTNCVEATRKMRVGPSGSAFRSGPQTTPSCCGQESWW